MERKEESPDFGNEKHGIDDGPRFTTDPEQQMARQNELHKSLKGRHMQMIAM